MVTRRRTRDEVALRDTEGRKWCLACHEWKPEEGFYVASKVSDGLMSQCKRCWDLYMQAYHQRHPETVRTRVRRWHTGVAQERFDAMVASQGGVCAICGAGEPGGVGGWHLDHDHACCPGKRACERCTRGALCCRCNLALGFARDDIAVLASMIRYLTSSASRMLTYQRI